MEKCIYCSKSYTVKGINLHKKKCKSKLELSILENNSNLKFDESKTTIKIIRKNIFDKLPDEMLIEIYKFLSIKDDFCSYRIFYKKYLIPYARILKRFFNLFYPTQQEILNFKKNIYEEKENNICKTTAKNIYPLKDKELDELIHHKLVKNPHYSSSPPMKIYNVADILDYLEKTYGSKRLYYDKLLYESDKKSQNKDKNNSIKEKRKLIYDALMNKYNFDENSEIYIEHKGYIIKGTPGIKNVKTYIISYIQKEERKIALQERLTLENIVFRKHGIVIGYINENKYSLENAFITLKNIQMRENLIKEEFTNQNLNFNEEQKKYKERIMIEEYIFLDKTSLEEIINYIKVKEIRKTTLIAKLEEHGLQLRQDSEVCDNYINNNEQELDYVVNTMIEMDFYFKYTDYRDEFKNAKYEYGGYYEDGEYEYDYISVSKTAKRRALRTWCYKYKNYEEAIESAKTYLPISLYEKIKIQFEDNEKHKELVKQKREKKLQKQQEQKKQQMQEQQQKEETICTSKKIVLEKFSNLFKCICNNIPSPICGCCKNCCYIEECKKHKKKLIIV
jgi:hypothetical protein